jgi:hypothetical protein
MTNELNAVELSDLELDTVAGGLAISFGDVQGFASDASNTFSQKNLVVGQQTFAGPNGSGTASMTGISETISKAFQGIAAR